MFKIKCLYGKSIPFEHMFPTGLYMDIQCMSCSKVWIVDGPY